MGPNTAPTDEDGKDLELDKTNDKNKEEDENSGEEDEDEDGLPNKINSEFKHNDNQESYFNNGTEEATNIGANTEVINVEVKSSGHNNVEGPDENVGEQSKSNKEQTEEGKLEKVTKTKTNEYANINEQELNTKTEEVTNMGADTEVISVSELQKHAESFHAKGAIVAMRTEEVENRMTEATDAKNSEELTSVTISGQETTTKDGWDSDKLEEEDIMIGNKGKTEEMTNDDEKACDTEGDKNTNRNTREMEEGNDEEIKTPSEQDPKKQETDEGLELASAEEAVKVNIMEENDDTEEKETKENKLNIIGTPDSQSQQEM